MNELASWWPTLSSTLSCSSSAFLSLDSLFWQGLIQGTGSCARLTLPRWNNNDGGTNERHEKARQQEVQVLSSG